MDWNEIDEIEYQAAWIILLVCVLGYILSGVFVW